MLEVLDYWNHLTPFRETVTAKNVISSFTVMAAGPGPPTCWFLLHGHFYVLISATKGFRSVCFALRRDTFCQLLILAGETGDRE
eukprot:g72471.t1